MTAELCARAFRDNFLNVYLTRVFCYCPPVNTPYCTAPVGFFYVRRHFTCQEECLSNPSATSRHRRFHRPPPPPLASHIATAHAQHHGTGQQILPYRLAITPRLMIFWTGASDAVASHGAAKWFQSSVSKVEPEPQFGGSLKKCGPPR
jgi:hypothetical protein